jgi:hypothetical protein
VSNVHLNMEDYLKSIRKHSLNICIAKIALRNTLIKYICKKTQIEIIFSLLMLMLKNWIQ